MHKKLSWLLNRPLYLNLLLPHYWKGQILINKGRKKSHKVVYEIWDEYAAHILPLLTIVGI